ncbi:hypothetical protein ASPZODRAFT_131998 [Penicilliopsis zonata CBS 506.65]|uniref:TauD/TfdA-like domain-containing protein n=1 Tax=Penicilliopsis zonata CBS 506.65 TaxID=1073090 RepID=A0A1L9SIM4_9EURO|nr:hypothetical protein ASPZODRAFT_131998 [Penicilliopsis zonata CBS 506.65]OJJ47065.1 hypothetical protein ASPZODRAFT_131998 [Penicilliopsis zonata CBS 506.65]
METGESQGPAMALGINSSDDHHEISNLENLTNAHASMIKESLVAQIPASSDEFQFPPGTFFTAATRQVGLDMRNVYRKALIKNGIVAIELKFDDPASQFLVDLVAAMQFKADKHSDTQGVLWDVKLNDAGVLSTGTGKAARSISHSLNEFDWHTDGAFETKPTRFFGLHIIHPDKMGGGVFRVARAEELVALLSPRTVATLNNSWFTLRVPPEFHKGVSTVQGKVLEIDPVSGDALVRYRRDIFLDPPSSNEEASAAVRELMGRLGDAEAIGEAIPAIVFKENVVILMDNARFLHSRTEIKDPRRWLRRIRFHDSV